MSLSPPDPSAQRSPQGVPASAWTSVSGWRSLLLLLEVALLVPVPQFFPPFSSALQPALPCPHFQAGTHSPARCWTLGVGPCPAPAVGGDGSTSSSSGWKSRRPRRLQGSRPGAGRAMLARGCHWRALRKQVPATLGVRQRPHHVPHGGGGGTNGRAPGSRSGGCWGGPASSLECARGSSLLGCHSLAGPSRKEPAETVLPPGDLPPATLGKSSPPTFAFLPPRVQSPTTAWA